MTRKEQKETRKKTILFTALELFVKNGYFDTKITDIAAASSMSNGLLFHYFESKEALLVELVKMGAAVTSSVGFQYVRSHESGKTRWNAGGGKTDCAFCKSN